MYAVDVQMRVQKLPPNDDLLIWFKLLLAVGGQKGWVYVSNVGAVPAMAGRTATKKDAAHSRKGGVWE